MKIVVPTLLFLLCLHTINAQVGVGTTSPNAILDIRSSNQTAPANTDGILIPKADEFPTTDPTAAQDGMLIYITGNGSETKGFYYWDQSVTDWVNATGVKQINDLLDGKSDNDGTDNGSSIFIGVESGLNDDGTNNRNVAIGYQAMFSNTSGQNNVAFGNSALYNNTSGVFNTATGNLALLNNTIGYSNSAFGHNVLRNNNSGHTNSAFGSGALSNNTVGYRNVAFGALVMAGNISGNENTAIGIGALQSNINGNYNVAVGRSAGAGTSGISKSGGVFIGSFAGQNENSDNTLYIENTDADPESALIYGDFGTDNTATGNILRTNSEFQIGNPSTAGYAFPTSDGSANQVLQTDGTGTLNWVDNTAIGVQRINDLIDGKSDNDGSDDGSSIFLGIDSGLNDNSSNNSNVGIGYSALRSNTSGEFNVGIGYNSLRSHAQNDSNTAIGAYSLLNGIANNNSNVSIGAFSGFKNRGSQNVIVGVRSGAGNTSDSNFNVVSGSIFLGYEAGRYELDSNKLYIENSNSSAPLIYGEFDNDILGFNGSVAIGHQTPNAKLHALEEGTSGDQTIVAILESDTSNRPTLLFSDDTTPTINSGMSIEYNGVNNHMALNNVGGTSLYQFSNGGDLTIQDGDLIIEDPGVDKQLRMMDNAGNADRVIIRQNSTNDIYIGDLDDNNGDLFLRSGGNNEMIIENGGQVGINTMTPAYDLEVNGDAAKPGGGTWIAASDRRLKTNIADYQKGLEHLKAIRPVSYHYNQLSGFDTSREHVGLIAQEVQKVVPTMVQQNKETDYLAVDSNELTYMLINAVKELSTEIEALKKQNQKLQQSLQTLKMNKQ